MSTDLAAQKEARANILLEVSALRGENAAQKKVEELTQHLVEDLSARDTSVTDRRHTGGARAVKEKLPGQAKELSARVIGIEGKVLNGIKTVTDLNIKLKADEKHAKYVAYERDCL